VAAGAVVIAAGVYEFTPLKQRFRRRCGESVRSGFGFGLCCAGSSIGLMVMLVALGVMSVTWMSVIAVLAVAQKLLPANAAIDVPLALTIVGLGVAGASPVMRPLQYQTWETFFNDRQGAPGYLAPGASILNGTPVGEKSGIKREKQTARRGIEHISDSRVQVGWRTERLSG
jgi:hypothetical protein